MVRTQWNRLLNCVFSRPSNPARRPFRLEHLEDRTVPALLNYYPAEGNANDFNLLNNGTLVGGATFAAGKFGQAFSFDGVNDLVSTTRQVANDFTLAAWIKTSTATGGGTNFFNGHPVVSAEVGGIVNDFGTTIINERFAFGIGLPDQTIEGTTDVVDGAWHHVAAVRQGTTIRVYVDGVLEKSQTVTNGGALTSSAVISIGGLQANNIWFPGLIDDVRIDNAAMSAAEIATLAKQTVVSEEFTGSGTPASLEQQGANASFPGTTATFPGPNRTYLRTVAADYFAKDFVAEVDMVSTGAGIAFFGVGDGAPNPANTNEPTNPTINLRLHSQAVATGLTHANDTDDSGNSFDNITTLTSLPNNGPHRLRLTWDAAAKTAKFEIDHNYAGGAFSANASSVVIDGSDNGFTAANSRLFFGGDGNATFDNLQIRSSPPAIVGTISATLVGTTLTLADTDGTGKNNALTASVVGANLVVSDAAEKFQSAPAGGTLSNGDKTLTIPLASVTSLVLNTAGGNDSLALVYPSLPVAVSYNGGAGADSLSLSGGGPFATVTHTFTNATDGSVAFGANTVAYTGLDPIADNLSAANRVFTFNGGAETITVTDSGGADGKTTIDSTLGESVTFTNPTSSLTINAGTGSDTVTISGVDAAYNAALTVNGEADTDTVNLNAAVTYAAGNSLAVSAETITVTAAQTLAGAGAVSLVAGQSVAVGANVTGGTGGVSIDGQGLAALNTVGVNIAGGAVVTATGLVTVTGKGGGAGGNAVGVAVVGGSQIKSGGSNPVVVTGTGGGAAGSAGGNHGVVVDGAGSTITSSGGDVFVTGTGGTSGGDSFGIQATTNSLITSGGSGNVTVIADAGANTGVANQRFGLLLRGGADITSGGAGTVTVTGTGGTNTNGGSFGINMLDAGTTITSGGGAVVVNGTGGTGPGGFYLGVVVDLGADILSGGNGDVQVTGTGGTGGGLNWGVYTQGSGSTISAGGAGTVTVTGFGGASTGDSNFGVLVAQSSLITSSGGAVTVSGTGGGTGASGLNLGVAVQTGGGIAAPAALTVTGTKGTNTAAGISVTGAGSSITAGGLATLTGGSGSNVTIDAAATANFGSLTASGGEVTITEDSDMAVNTVSGSVVTLASSGAISDNNGAVVNVTAANLVLSAVTGIDLDTTIANLTATNTTSGGVTINETDGLNVINGGVQAKGAVTLTAGGDVLVTDGGINNAGAAGDVSVTTTAGTLTVRSNGIDTAGSVTLSSPGTVTVFEGGVDALAGTGTVSITSTGAGVTISDTGVDARNTVTVTAAGPVLVANGGIDNSTGTGDITISTTVGTATVAALVSKGNVSVTAPGLVTVNQSGINTTSGTGSVSITSTGGGVTVTDSGVDAKGTVTVLAAGATSIGGSGIDNSTGTGNVSVTTSVGTLAVTDGGISTAGTVTLSAPGQVVIDQNGVNAASGTGTVSIASTGGGVSVEDGGVQAKNTITVTAVGTVTIAGNGLNNHQGGTGGGTVSVTSSASGINITDGGIQSTSTVTLSAANGEITTPNGGRDVLGTVVTATAKSGIDLDTQVGSITASTGASGGITIDETDAVTLTSVTTANGPITVSAGGTITVTSVVSTTDADTNDISITASTGNILVGTVTAGTTAGDATLTATAGSIYDGAFPAGPATNLVTGDLVTLIAAVDIGSAPPIVNVNTTANAIVATTTGAPNAGTRGIWINETNAVTLQDVTTVDGLIRITTGGTTQIGTVVANGTGRNTTVIASTGDVTVGTIAKSAAGSVTLTATAGSLTVSGGASVVAGIAVTGKAGKNLLVNGPVAGGGVVQFLFGLDDAGRSADVNAAINGSSALVQGDAGADTITVTVTGTADLTVDGKDAADDYLVLFGLLGSGDVVISDTGAAGTDQAFLTGTAGADVFDVNTATSGTNAVTRGGAERVTYSAANLEEMRIDAGQDDDTFHVWFANSQLPGVFTLVGGGSTLGDVANVSGTDLDDAGATKLDVGFTQLDRVSRAGEAVNYDGTLEALVVFAKDGSDHLFARPDVETRVTVHGGAPAKPTTPGDVLQLNVFGTAGQVPSNPLIPDGQITFTSHQTIDWTGIESLPVPLGLGASFDLGTAASPVQAGTASQVWLAVPNTKLYAAGPYGWNAAVQAFDRTPGSFKGIQTGPTFDPSAPLFRDGHWNYSPGKNTFSVAVAPGQQVWVTLFMGDSYDRYFHLNVYADGSKAVNDLFLPQNELQAVRFLATDNGDGRLDLAIEQPNSSTYWILNGLDVRPAAWLAPITIRRDSATTGVIAPSAAADSLVADGLSTDTYFFEGVQPNQFVTVATTNGTVVSADADAYLAGVQVKADATGKGSFLVRRPTGTATAAVSVYGSYLDSASDANTAPGHFQQQFTLPPTAVPVTRQIDFGSKTSPVAVGFVGVPNTQVYTTPTGNALGWVGGAVDVFDRGAAAGDLLRDGAWSMPAGARDFHLDVPDGTYQLTVLVGDPGYARDKVSVLPAAGFGTFVSQASPLRNPGDIATKTGETASVTYTVSVTGGTGLRLRFADGGGADGYWTAQGLYLRTTQKALTVAQTGAAAANGVASATFGIEGGVPGSLVTVDSTLGTVSSADASTRYAGVQVLLDGDGKGSFAVQSPFSTTGLTGKVAAVDVTGAAAGQGAAAFDAPAGGLRFDFNGPATATAAGFVGVRGNDLYSAAKGYGWKQGVFEYDRGAGAGDLSRDGAWGFGGATPYTFQVGVAKNAAVDVTFHLGDPTTARTVFVSVEGGGAEVSVATKVNEFKTQTVSGSDLNGDGVIDVGVRALSSGYWTLAGLEVAGGAVVLNQLAGPAGAASGSSLTADRLGAVVAEAIARWAAAGVKPEQVEALKRVTFTIADLAWSGRLGQHTPGRVTLDDDGNGGGWFVDPTPADDGEFAAAPGPGGYDLLTVVMHELGHELGRIDRNPDLTGQAVMAESLPAGVRRSPTPIDMTGGATPAAAAYHGSDTSAPIDPRTVTGDPLSAGGYGGTPFAAAGSITVSKPTGGSASIAPPSLAGISIAPFDTDDDDAVGANGDTVADLLDPSASLSEELLGIEVG